MKSQKMVKSSIDRTIKIYQRDKISFQLNIAKPEWTEKQKELIEIVKNSDAKHIFIKGPSGTSKTFLSLAIGLELLNAGRVKEIVFVRSIVEAGAISLGSLPGEFGEKISPFMAPFEEKLKLLLPKEDIKKLNDDKRIISLPINYLRGLEFNASYVIFDEAQNANEHEIQTYLTRYGKYSKFILCGDTEQIDYLKGKKLDSGFQSQYQLYDDEISKVKGLFCFKFGISDIMRDDVVKYIVEKYDEYRRNK